MDDLNTTLKVAICASLFFFSVAATLLTEASKNSAGAYPYNTFMIPCIVETIKLCISCALLLRLKIKDDQVVMSFLPIKFASFSLPAFCYFISNNCMFYIIRELGPTTYQITNNLKVIATGLLMRVVLGRKLTWPQWKALVLLVLGSVVATSKPNDDMKSSVLGYIFVFINAFAAGAGGVVSEKLLKGNSDGVVDNFHWQNVQLYFFGLAFGLASSITYMNSASYDGLLDGFNIWACGAILSLSGAGLLVSLILKHLDNFAKCFVGVVSIIAVAAMRAFFMNDTVSLNLAVGIVLTCMALEQFNLPQQ